MPAGGLLLNKRIPGGSGYKLVGNVGTPGNVNIFAAAATNGITVTDGAILSVAGITFSGGVGSNSMFANRGGVINIVGDVIFGQNQNAYNILLFAGGILNIDTSYHVAAGTTGFAHIGAFYNSAVTFGKTGGSAIAVTHLGTTAWTGAYYYCQLNATIVSITSISYPGASASGVKGQVDYNAIVNAGGAAVPGDLPAQVSNGGFFF